MQYYWCPYTKGKLGHRYIHRGEDWSSARRQGTSRSQERRLKWFPPLEPSEGAWPCGTLSSDFSRTVRQYISVV